MRRQCQDPCRNHRDQFATKKCMAHEPSMSNSCEICGGSWSMRVCLILLKIKLEPLQNKNQAAIQWPGFRIHDNRYNMVNPISSFTTLVWTHSKTTSSFARDKHPQATNGLIVPISDNDIHAVKTCDPSKTYRKTTDPYRDDPESYRQCFAAGY